MRVDKKSGYHLGLRGTRSSSTVVRRRRPYEPAQKLETARVRKVGACMQCRQKKVKCRHTIQSMNSKSASNSLTSASLLHGQSVSSNGTATGPSADMPMGYEIGTVLQVMSEDAFLDTLAPPDSFDDTTMLSPDSRYDIRDMKPYDELFGNTQTLETDAYSNDQAIATYADTSLGFTSSGSFQQEAVESNSQQTVDIDEEEDVLGNEAYQKHSTHEQVHSSSAQQPWTPSTTTDNFQGSRYEMHELSMNAFQYGSMNGSRLGLSLTQMNPSLQHYENEPGHLNSQFHLAFEYQPRPVHGVDVVYDALYPQGFQAPRSDFDDVVTTSNLPFGFEEVSQSVSDSHLCLAPSEATPHGSFAGTPQLLGESLSPTQASTARQSSSELGTLNGRLGRNDDSWKRGSTWPFSANMSEGIQMAEDVEDMVESNWNSYPSMKQ